MKAEPNVQDIEDEKFDYDFSLVYFTKESAEKVKAAIENVSEIKEAVVGTFKVQLEGAEEAAHEESAQTEEKESKPVTKTEDKPKTQAAATKGTTAYPHLSANRVTEDCAMPLFAA